MLFNKLAIRTYHTSKNVRGYAGQGLWNGCHRFQSSYVGSQACSIRDSDGFNDPAYLKKLYCQNDPETVIRMFESQPSLHSNPLALSEYVKALIKLDRLDDRNIGSAILRVQEESVGKTPINGYLKNKLWRTFRYLRLGTVLVSGVYGLSQLQGISEGLDLNTEEVQPSKESRTKFSDVKGVDEAKSELEEIVHYLVDRERCPRLGGNFPKGVLLYGPPGSEKTLLAKAIAGEAGVPFFSCKGTDFEEMSAVVGPRKVKNIFAAAKKKSPCVVFIDEIDAICGDRRNMKMTLNQLFDELDHSEHNNGIIVIAATDNPKSLDEALGKPGRFDSLVLVSLFFFLWCSRTNIIAMMVCLWAFITFSLLMKCPIASSFCPRSVFGASWIR